MWPYYFKYLLRVDVEKWVPLMGHIQLANMKYLRLRCGRGRSGGRWYVRVIVPVDLQKILDKKTIERALKTSDRNEARKLAFPILTEIFAGFDRARSARITSADIEHEAKLYLRKRLSAIQQHPGTTFEAIPGYAGREMPSYGELSLLELYQLAEDEDWPIGVDLAATEIWSLRIPPDHGAPAGSWVDGKQEAC